MLRRYTRDNPGWADEFHVYAMDWDENRIVLSVDGRAVNDSSIAEVKNARYRAVENPFHQPHYLLVNLALGGDNGGDVTAIPFPGLHVRRLRPRLSESRVILLFLLIPLDIRE